MSRTLGIDVLNDLQSAAYMCDGEDIGVFLERVLPHLHEQTESENWALAGMLLSKYCLEAAGIVAAYASVRRRLPDGQSPPGPIDWYHPDIPLVRVLLRNAVPDPQDTVLGAITLDEAGRGMFALFGRRDPRKDA